MKIMDKFQEGIETVIVPIASKLNGQRHVCAVRDAFILTFPLTMAASLMVLINFAILSSDGFLAKIFYLEKLIPNLSSYQAIFSPIIRGSTDILAILIVFLIARNLAQYHKIDYLLTGLTGISVFFIIYPDYVIIEGSNHLMNRYMGAQGLFVAIIVGIIVGELMAILSKWDFLEIKMPEQVPPAVSRTFRVLLPIILVTIFFAISNYLLKKLVPGGIHELVYSVIQKPLTNLSGNVVSVLIISLISQVLWVMGIHGPNTIAAVRDTMFSEANNANLAYLANGGDIWDVPFPVTWGGLNDAFANYGGSGCTLGLIIAIFLFSKAQEQRSIAKLSFAPGLFNINETIIFGLPIVLNPIYIIPFILTPLVNTLIGYIAIVVLKIMPPVAYGVPWTTPGFLIPFLGSGGNNIISLIVGLACLVVSVLIYMPFVIAASKAEIKEKIS